ncbi:hypothetical protein MJT46_007185 [Ovis ammon polii x Ovis aries]|nr:hypothetical protein MJT46_007185 [Ovis ammon polii x Ovis aries]
MLATGSGGRRARRLLLSLLLLAAWETGSNHVRYSVSEEAKHGTFVGRIAQDLGLELAELVPRLFRVASKGRGDLLEVNLQNGILFVNSRIDREELCGRSAECSIHLEVIVDRPLQVFHVEVEVKDINDNPPVFPATHRNLFISEARALESHFSLEGASDADIGENALLTYRLTPNEYFSLEVPSNDEQVKPLELVLKKRLDREVASELLLVLKATDGGKPELTGSVKINITVLDANDNAPVFDKAVHRIKLLENARNGTLIIRLNASDLDEGSNGHIIYSFATDVSSNTEACFRIDSNSGEIRVNGKIDFEETKLWKLQIEAVDKGNPPMFGHCTVLIEVLDINDNAPELLVTSLLLSIPEDAPLGTVITLIRVTDRDVGSNAQVTCSLTPHVPFKLVSTFKNYYSLVLDSSLDREKVSEYALTLIAKDGGSPSLSTTASVSVEVADVNDNAPAFSQPEYTVFLKENNPPGCHIFTVSARDADAQENALVSYSLVERRVGERALSSYVSVHAESGKVYALQPLDHEELELLQFQVSARDAGVPPLGSNVTLQVFVLDENDNAPALLPPGPGGGPSAVSQVVSRSVDAGHVVAKVRAVDADSGYNAWLSYELQLAAGGARSPFRVGLYTGEISTTRALDEADAPRQRLLVLVKDHGEPALTATATVLLSLEDSGQAPKASSRALSGAAGAETALVDVNVYLIIAICAVSSLFVLTLLLYTALRCSAPPSEGTCGPVKPRLVCSSAVGSWSYSQERRQRVCSGEGPPKTDLIAFSPSVPPGLNSGDIGDQQEFCENDPLKLLKDSARYLTRNWSLWYCKCKVSYFGTWEAGSGQVHYSVPEEAKHGTFVGRIAQDLGLELTDLVPRLFRVASKGRGDLLEVNLQNGILFVNSRIDREELCGRSTECSIHLEVIVDRPLQVFHVEVEVKDINDNPPVFSLREQKLMISESKQPDSRFPLEGASDADVGENALLTYRLSKNEYFSLELPINSKPTKKLSLTLKKSLDREKIPEFNLLLTAADGGKPELTGTVQLFIRVLDVNDNDPEFEQSEYRVRLMENSAKETLVIQLNATDEDEGVNGEVTYSLMSIKPNGKPLFTLDENKGEVKVNGTLDYEENKFYEIEVQATDKGNPPMAGHCTVWVEILDANDNAPEITVTSLSLPVREDTQPSTVIALISVSDRDSGNNGQVICFLTPNVPFKIVSTFKNYYSLVLDGTLDRESVSVYRLVVTARDGGSPSLSATASVSVEVADVNDNAPAFAQPEYTVFVKENNPPGCHIFTVSARDADAQENALVSYSLVERRVGERALSSYVSVHAESGKVYALQPLDHEELELLQFQVSARDAGVPPLGSNVTLQVFVLDENDNAPALLPLGTGRGPSAVSQVVLRSVDPGHVVAKVRAVDADSGYNAWLSYELQPTAGGARSPFRVGLYTGEISTTRALDEADAPRQRLLVLVKDHGEPALTATATVLLSLEDSGQAPKASSRALSGAAGAETALVDVNVYLIIAICAVSSLFVLTLLLYTALRCWAPPSEGACGPVKPRLVCSSAVGSWSYSQERRQRVCSGEGPPKTDLMAFSPSLPPGLDREVGEERQEAGSHHSGLVKRENSPSPDSNNPQNRIDSILTGKLAWESGSGQVHYSVPEEAKHGTFVGRIAQDLGLELAELVPRLFRVASKGRGDLLEVNLQNGILFVNSRIDREELCGRSAECSINLEVIVDRPLQVFHVEVEVKDINDNPPVFRGEQKVLISESAPLESRFPLAGASDADIGLNSLLTYRLSLNEYFTLKLITKTDKSILPELILRKSLDREEIPELNMLLTALDGGKPQLTESVQIQITILDVNDNAPEFDKPGYKVVLFENVPNGTRIIQLNASDLDEGPNRKISYEIRMILPLSEKCMFLINPQTGEIRIYGKLDFEENNEYEIQVNAIDKGIPPMAGHCTVLVEVLDLNDNTPEVMITSLSLPVREDAQVGTVIALISVSDCDSGANGQVTCSLTPPHIPFKLVSTFKNYYTLVLDSVLDRESASNYEVMVTARDGGSPSLSATASVSVEVADVNDNAPAFAQPEYTVFVKENNPPGCHIFTVSARDADAQENALVSYSLVERRVGERALSSYVSVHAESGKVYALQPLDHEELELLQFQVSARDAGVPPLGSNVTLQVFVLDENDNAPALLPPGPGGGPSTLSQVVARSVGAGHVVAKVRAVDADSGYNAWLSYELQPAAGGASSPFRVGLYSGEISTTRALDEADAPRQRLLVLVKDHGEPALTATATVLLSLEDSGQAPKASSRALSGAAGAETALVDVNVYLIIAICAVSSLFVLTLLLYTALRCSAPPSEGACGPVKPRLVCSSAVGSWSYSQERRQRVCSGEGPPKTDLMAFSPCLPASGEDCLNPSSEIIYEFLALKEITWESGSGQVHYSVPEEAKHGTFVGRIAQDLGLELAELVPRLFRVASKGRGDLLEVNLQNGILFVNSRIDREELCGRSAECSIHLEVIVDRPLQVFHVEVEVTDINDNPPVFPESEKRIIIAESRPPETRFPLDGASDADIGVNSALTYRVDPNDYFTLDTQNSREQMSSLSLVLRKPLDREEIQEHSLLLTASDGGKPELTSTVQLLITILDVNDNAPEFDQLIYKVRMLENSLNGSLVIKLNATDPDDGTNADITYSFRRPVSPAVLYAFYINPDSGEIRTKGKLDFEENKLYEISVEAIDKGNIPMAGHCTILVEIVDINDNAPEVTITSLALPVREDAQVGTVIALISVSDRDSGANGQVTCSLMPHNPFKLVSTFKNYYSLVLDNTLNRESVANYEVVVTARDGGLPSLSATASVSVEVADVNDNAPAFAQPEYTVFVKENNPPGCHIFTVSARDADAQENALVSYSLVERRVGERALSSYVSVHAESGKVYALQPLDHEELELLQFQVSARDAGVPPLGSNVTLQVFVLDENDNAPALLPPGPGGGPSAVSQVVSRSVETGHVVAKVRAVDADSGYNAWLSYELQPVAGGARSPFRVGLYSGEISTTRALDEADAPRQRLLVLVKDHGEPALTATATVLLSLEDSGQAPKASSRALSGAAGAETALVDVNVYLIIAICAVSSLFVLTLLLYTALRCSAPPSEGKCGLVKPRLVCSSAVGSWSYSQQKQQRVCSGEGPPKTDLMAFSPSLPPCLSSSEGPGEIEAELEQLKKILE